MAAKPGQLYTKCSLSPASPLGVAELSGESDTKLIQLKGIHSPVATSSPPPPPPPLLSLPPSLSLSLSLSLSPSPSFYLPLSLFLPPLPFSLKVIKNPVTDHLPTGALKIGTSFHSDDLVDVKSFAKDGPVVFVVGAMAHGRVSDNHKTYLLLQ